MQYAEPSPWVRVQVKRSQPEEDGQWILGCQFTEPQPWSVLLFFG
jgi:hypothetical protein